MDKLLPHPDLCKDNTLETFARAVMQADNKLQGKDMTWKKVRENSFLSDYTDNDWEQYTLPDSKLIAETFDVLIMMNFIEIIKGKHGKVIKARATQKGRDWFELTDDSQMGQVFREALASTWFAQLNTSLLQVYDSAITSEIGEQPEAQVEAVHSLLYRYELIEIHDEETDINLRVSGAETNKDFVEDVDESNLNLADEPIVNEASDSLDHNYFDNNDSSVNDDSDIGLDDSYFDKDLDDESVVDESNLNLADEPIVNEASDSLDHNYFDNNDSSVNDDSDIGLDDSYFNNDDSSGDEGGYDHNLDTDAGDNSSDDTADDSSGETTDADADDSSGETTDADADDSSGETTDADADDSSGETTDADADDSSDEETDTDNDDTTTSESRSQKDSFGVERSGPKAPRANRRPVKSAKRNDDGTPPNLRPGQSPGIGRFGQSNSNSDSDQNPENDNSSQSPPEKNNLPPMIHPNRGANRRGGIKFQARGASRSNSGSNEGSDLPPNIRPGRGGNRISLAGRQDEPDLPRSRPGGKSQLGKRPTNDSGLPRSGGSPLDDFKRAGRRNRKDGDSGTQSSKAKDRVENIIGGIIDDIQVDIILRNSEQYEIHENGERVFYVPREDIEIWQKNHGEEHIADAIMNYRDDFFTRSVNSSDDTDE